MREIQRSHSHKKLFVTGLVSVGLIVSLTALALPQNSPANPAISSHSRAELVRPSVSNPPPASDMCQNLQVLVLVDRSGSVGNAHQKYKDQITKIWHILHNISATYGGFSSGYVLAFATRTADQMPRLLAKDNNKDGVVNESDRDLLNNDVLAGYDGMTQDIYFSSSGGSLPSNQTPDYGYNPKNEYTGSGFGHAAGTNWHDGFLSANEIIKTTNGPSNSLRDYNMVIMITDGEPTLDDGPNHKWDLFVKGGHKIDENFDGRLATPSHVTRTKEVVDALRSGRNVADQTQAFTPVQVHGVLIGGGSIGAQRMTDTFGSGNWFQSANFDSTLGTQLLKIVGETCPPAPSLTASMTATFIDRPTSVIEDSDVTYTVDITNTSTATLDNINVGNGTVVALPTDSSYTSEGLLSPGKKRRYVVTQHIGGGANTTLVSIPYSARVSEDPSMMAPGSEMELSGSILAGLFIRLVPRPS